MYIYESFETGVFTVGFYNPHGKFVSESDHGTIEEAAERVMILNGDFDCKALYESKILKLQKEIISLKKLVLEAICYGEESETPFYEMMKRLREIA